MTLLIVIAAIGFLALLAVGAASETWRARRRDAPADGDVRSVRFRCRPRDRRLEAHLAEACQSRGLQAIAPVWGDRWYLVEGPPAPVTALATQLLTEVDEAGFTVARDRGRRTVLRRGLRFLTLERSY